MSRIAFVNGTFVPYADATVSIADRGFLFADAIYEVAAVLDRRLVDNDAHLARLARSLAEIRLPNPYDAAEWTRIETELVARNGLAEGLVYMQVTRGAAERDFGFPADGTPTVVMFTQEKAISHSPAAERGMAVVTVPDLRWARRDIKSVGLLGQVLAKQAAVEAGAGDAWMVENGTVTEGSSSTAFIVTTEGRIVTRPLSRAILPGITRAAIMRLASEAGLVLEERPFTVEEAQTAAEAFATSASAIVMPVIAIDGVPVGSGRPGPHAVRLRALYLETARAGLT